MTEFDFDELDRSITEAMSKSGLLKEDDQHTETPTPRILFCFHSTKEGFKADQQRRHPCLFSIAHRSPRSPCRVKRLRAPASKRLCISPKRASTPRSFRAIGGRRTAYKDILQKYKTWRR